jgi:hypothetical protein
MNEIETTAANTTFGTTAGAIMLTDTTDSITGIMPINRAVGIGVIIIVVTGMDTSTAISIVTIITITMLVFSSLVTVLFHMVTSITSTAHIGISNPLQRD